MENKFLDELKNWKINKFKEEIGIIEEENIVSDDDLEGDLNE